MLIQVIKHVGKVNGTPIFSALHSVVNEYGKCHAMTLTINKAHHQIMPALAAIPASLQMYGHSEVELMYTDNVQGDKAELE